MSEKRGRAALDARQSEYFIKRDQERSENNSEEEEGEVEEEETNPTVQRHPLRRADSDDQLRQQFEDDSREEIRTSYGRMQKSRSTGQLKLVGIRNVKDKKIKK